MRIFFTQKSFSIAFQAEGGVLVSNLDRLFIDCWMQLKESYRSLPKKLVEVLSDFWKNRVLTSENSQVLGPFGGLPDVIRTKLPEISKYQATWRRKFLGFNFVIK